MNEYTKLTGIFQRLAHSFRTQNINKSIKNSRFEISFLRRWDKRCRNCFWNSALRLLSRHRKPGNRRPQTKKTLAFNFMFDRRLTTENYLPPWPILTIVLRISSTLPAAKWLNQSPSHSLVLMIICHNLTSHDVLALSRDFFSCDYGGMFVQIFGRGFKIDYKGKKQAR